MNWQDLDVHHIGIVVEDIDEAQKLYDKNGNSSLRYRPNGGFRISIQFNRIAT